MVMHMLRPRGGPPRRAARTPRLGAHTLDTPVSAYVYAASRDRVSNIAREENVPAGTARAWVSPSSAYRRELLVRHLGRLGSERPWYAASAVAVGLFTAQRNRGPDD